jgi:hypothetical protein
MRLRVEVREIKVVRRKCRRCLHYFEPAKAGPRALPDAEFLTANRAVIRAERVRRER